MEPGDRLRALWILIVRDSRPPANLKNSEASRMRIRQLNLLDYVSLFTHVNAELMEKCQSGRLTYKVYYTEVTAYRVCPLYSPASPKNIQPKLLRVLASNRYGITPTQWHRGKEQVRKK